MAPFLFAPPGDPGDHMWIREHAAEILHQVDELGVVLLRGLSISGSKSLARVLEVVMGGGLLEYVYRSTPRTRMRGNVYTSTEYNPLLPIVQHNENAYSNKWPMRLAFYCMLPAAQGGATPIADSSLIYDQIPAEIRREFEHKKLMYVRNYGDLDLPWEEVFQTSDKDQVARYCAENAITLEWLGNNRLRTSQINEAGYYHPRTGKPVWFNQAHLFHVSNLDPEFRAGISATVDNDVLPRNVYYGDGTPISDDVIDTIKAVYRDNTVSFVWEQGDLMILDNMRYSHGREPYSGSRKILVGMSGLADTAGLTPRVG